MLADVIAGERSIAASGDADPTVVWERYRTPARWPQWAPHLTGVESSTATIRPGTTGTVTALHVVRARFEVAEVDETARSWAWTVALGPVRLALRHDVTTTAGGSRTGLVVRGPRGVIDAYLPVAAWALRRLVTP